MPVKMKKLRLTSKTRRAWQGRSRGFTLIEVVIAIALIGIVGAAILSALSTASLALIIADRRATAESIARTQMEYVKNQSSNPYEFAPNGGEVIYVKIADIPDGYAIWSINREDVPVEDVIGVPWDSGNNTAAYVDAGIQRIKLVIKNDDDVIVTLEDYKRRPIVESE